MKKNALIDIPVLLIFMARPIQFQQVFNQVKTARPTKLFLYQDGPRKSVPSDIENIAKCREIAGSIDWDCDVFTFFQEKNVGCDPSEYVAQKWMFSHVDRGIILEDDVVPSQSFFPFCKELLEKYYDDKRINYICGMNHLEKYENAKKESYFFTTSGSISGWATWKRNVDLWDEKMTFLDDPITLRLLKKTMGKEYFNRKINVWNKHKKSNVEHYESILSSNIALNSQLNIVPTKNLTSNIGIVADSTHSVDSLRKLPPKVRKIFFMETYEIDIPLIHPKYVINDLYYKEEVDKILLHHTNIVKRLFKKLLKISSSLFHFNK